MKVPKEQRSFFDKIDQESVIDKTKKNSWKLCVDGASRGNPGPSGVGIFLQKNEKTFLKEGYFLHNKTNNQAEYLALLIGILLLKKEMQRLDQLTVISDSQLLIYQMQGKYRVKHPEMKKLYSAVKQELSAIPTTFIHVEREYNTIADQLANQGVDSKKKLPLQLLNVLGRYEIIL